MAPNPNDVLNENSSLEGIQSPALLLLHEMGHANYYQDNPDDWYKGATSVLNNGYDRVEEQRNIDGLEARVAKRLGEPTRTNHSGYFILPSGRDSSTIRVSDPTEHAPSRDFN